MTVSVLVPRSRRRRVTLLVSAVRTLLTVELTVRRSTVAKACAGLGLSFAAFSPPAGDERPLPFRCQEYWWAVERVCAIWPVARRRMCLRRSLALGHLLRDLRPTLCLQIRSSEPFLAHAWLVVHGQHLDMGETGQQARAA